MDDSSKLMVSVPPRSSFDTLFTGGFSPGPMTLVSSFFSDPDNCSFSQLLAGAMASPIGTPTNSFGSTSTITYSGEDATEQVKDSGYKQNRPMGLLVAQSPLFMIPPGLTPSGLLNSPGFLSPLQSPFGMSHQQALAHVTAQAAYTQSYMQIQTQPSELALKTESNSPEIPISSPEKKPATYSPVEKMENDGYNWRKYGQKQVKASEHPRSYYRCTNMNCPVKKKVERSVNGNITEITYKGQHNHDPPVLNKRSKDSGPQIKSTGDELALIEVPEHSEMLESAIIVKDEDENEQPNAKRRCSEANSSSHKTVTESRIVVQTRSEVDLLDDGFKWRKYGQKVVKGNPYPRSYYRCTYTGCNVRKHVERSSTDPKAVITTYEGKHDHDLPTAKNSCGNTNKKLNTKRAIKSGIEFQHKDQVPALLQLKEGEITV